VVYTRTKEDTECRLYFSKKNNNISLQCLIPYEKNPTIYINNIEQKLAYTFSTGSKGYVSFDRKLSINDQVSFTNQYSNYQIENKGWADCNFKSSVSLYKDGIMMNDFSLSELPFNSLLNISYPEYTDRNSYKSGADYAKAIVDIRFQNLLTYKTDDNKNIIPTGFTRKNVADYLFSVE
jgi:hypothetical protein